MSSSYESEDLVANKLQAGTNLINEGDFLVKDKVGVVTSLKDEGALKVAVPETLPKDVADDQLPIVGMKSIFKKVLKCLKKEEEEEEEEEEDYDDHYHDDDDDDYNYDYDKEEDDDVGIIGVYGMGGVGKTTLLKQIKKKLLQMKNDFDFVIWVVDLQHDKIQLQIGEQIGLFDNKVWEDKNFEDKASDIFKILEEKKFVLLMDGLWERVDLTKVGVPLPDPENSSKIVFSTRSLQICSLMEADKLFKVKCLRYREAWKLFKASVVDETLRSHREVWDHETLGSHLDVRDLRDVCGECRGLPLALVSIGRTMASKKTPEEWSDVLGVLRRSTTSYSGLDDQLKKDIRDNLKLSYYNLQNDMFKSCFLYCCLFPRELEIKKGDLIDYWIGEGFLDESLGAVQSQGHYIIDVFLSVCLLEQSGKDDSSVKMHHWIHDMSLWIASKIETEEGNCFFCPDTYNFKDDIKEAQVIRDNLAKATRISLRNDKVMEMLRDPPRCPLLQTLFLIRNGSDVISEDHFFNVMPSLKVLNLSSNYWFTKLPLGISELLSLQHLDLSGTKIQELPTELRVLKILKCLNLEETRSLLKIPRQLISEFSMLHVLRLWECGFMLQPNEDTVVCNDAQLLIEELLYLKNLSMLSITLNNSHALQRLLSSNRLQSCIQSLCLRDLSHAKSIKVPLTDLKHLNTLEISNCKYLGELEVDFVGEAQAQDVRESPCSFYFLHEVIISNCRKLRELTWLILAPNLKHLRISDCEEMEEIINVGKLSKRPELMRNVTPFSKLKFLTLTNLPKLRSIYWTDLPFPDLKAKPNITGCPDSLVPPRLLKSAIAYLPQLQMPTATGKQSSRGFFAKEKLNIELGFGDGAGAETYPERPEEADCIHYLRTGFCRYGSRCRFNHPRERGTVMGAARATGGDFPERADQPICQYFMRTGTCKFGASCKYHHPRQGAGSVSHVSLNLYGYPLRPGDKECSYYLKTEKCKFGATCKFHHPQPASYVYLPYPGSVNPVASPGTQPTVGSSSIYGIHPQLSASAAAYPGSYQSMPISVGLSSSNRKEFPERPGQPECQYFLRTGDCKHGSSCRYHHPREVIVPKPDAVLSPLGLPSRPGAPLCIFYAQHGICKFGPACKFDHPVAPYPVGASIGTLAPSSSSSDLRPELISGSSKDSATTRMSSTISTSSGSVGSIFSKSGPVPHSSMQQSMQSFGPSTTGGNGSSTEARTSSLFPENHSISRKELIECWISEGILEGRNGMQNEGYRNINDLVRACLLEEAEDNCVKMHDVIRDMAMWIATKVEKENEGFFVRTGVELTEIPKIDEWESIRRMSVIKNKIESLAMIPRCPRLKTLFLNSYNLKTISGNFFQSMPSLTVLNLSDNPLTNLPSDISTLVSLQHLDLSCTAIKELPQELESLRELKCLNLEHTCQLQTIPRRLISNFSKLQVLRLWEFGSSGQAPEDNILFNGAESLTEELLCLQHLNMLSITIKSDHAFETFFKSKKLQNCTQSLCIQSLPQQNCLNALVVDLKQMDTLKIMDYKCLAELQLDCSADMGSIRESSWFSKPSHSQHKLLPKIERLAWLVLAPNLKCLVVSSCSNIKDIICDKKIVDIPEKIRKTIPFKKLEFLDLQRLQNLKSIYWNAMSFRHLKEIKVIQCPKLS